MKTLKTCLVILCLLHVRAVGLPQSNGATYFMGQMLVKHKSFGDHVVYFDDADFELLMQYKWTLIKPANTIYCQTRNDGKGKMKYMHRIIMNPRDYEIIDHKDHNGLNNQRSNLRICNHQQNNCNSRLPTTNKTGFRGVSYRKDKDAYVVTISFNNKTRYIGFFKDINKAAAAWNRAATNLHGEFATLNKIPH